VLGVASMVVCHPDATSRRFCSSSTGTRIKTIDSCIRVLVHGRRADILEGGCPCVAGFSKRYVDAQRGVGLGDVGGCW
jgi:hypothetical protein